MSTEYRLVVNGDTPVEQIAERAFPDPVECPTGTPPLLAADLYERRGFDVTVRAGHDGYLETESDNGVWEWEPRSYVAVTFRVEKNADPGRAIVNMLTVVGRLLDTGQEDAALILNGDYLLLTRFGGVLVKHRRAAWWENYADVNDVIRG